MLNSKTRISETFYPQTNVLPVEVKRVGKALIAFLVAFGLTIACTVLKLIVSTTSALSFLLLAFTNLLTIAITLLVMGIFFGVFYLLANIKNLVARKSTTLAIFLGITVGGFVSVFLFWMGSPLFQASVYASFITSSFILYFFPSLTALLMVELRNKKQQSLTQLTVQN
jgi:hypothetical protein